VTFFILFMLGLAGRGTSIETDCGYWTHPPGNASRKWVSLPKMLILEGMSDDELSRSLRPAGPYFVFREEGRRLSGSSQTLGFLEVNMRNVNRLVPGNLPLISIEDVEVQIRK
jgi:hypothetical protein